MRILHPAIILVTLTALAVAGCGTTSEQSTPAPAPSPSPAPENPISFRTSTDTIATSHHPGEASADSRTGERGIRFMVQIGAFQDPANASAVQLRARERFRTPVLNDYHPSLKLYQVRIGFFEDYHAANRFRSQMIQEHPADYGDSWIVQLKR